MHPKEKSAAAKFVASNKIPSMLNQPFSASDSMLVKSDETSLHAYLRNRLKKINIDGEDLYIAEGDTLLDEAQLEIYALQKEAANNARKFDEMSDEAGLGKLRLSDEPHRGLIGITHGGRVVRWEQGMVLSYCVIRSTFSSAENYHMVRTNFKAATQAWEATCGIKFEYKDQLDNSSSTDPSDIGVVFIVRELDAGGNFIAAAFFPNDPVFRRQVLIDPSYYGTGDFDKTGVLRHELGHVLGFRHEHISRHAPSSCPKENIEDTIELTNFDSRSVMHYLCGGVGDPELKITELDKVGAQRVYGPPLHTTMFVS